MRTKSVVALIAAVAVLMPPAQSVAAQSVAAPAASPLQWGKCPAFDPPTVTQSECATLEVPLDYSAPDGAKIQLAVSRLSAADPAKRRGVLLTNSGGPGGAGQRFPADLVDVGLPKSVRDTYDIIGFDPRGVGRSAPVTCDLTAEQNYSSIPPYARNAADVLQQANRSRQIADQCGKSSTAALLPHISTANTARDMDTIRAALGERKVSYLGISYGTYLGAVYATMFPQRTDRVVLDSSTGPDGWDFGFQRNLARGFEERFPDFAKYVAARPQLGLGTTPRQVRAKYDALAARLDRTTTAGRSDGALFRQATFARLYYDKNFPELAGIWQAVDTGTPQRAAAAAAANDNYLASQLHVLCNDSRWPRSVLTYQVTVAIDRIRHPMFGAAAGGINACAFWPNRTPEHVRIDDHGPSNILIAQNLRDPATPLAGARAMQAALGDRARMVTADQGGHLGYLFKDNRCLNDAVTTFLATGNRPHRDLNCKA